ncbi:MAG: glycosyltransferase [Candidatus Liptonbacteria bacterium]|nr:glycosyltransferase [Candidatus Liptonbacteria bacterium]
MQKSNGKSEYIMYLGSYPPRECGIATFTQDLTNAFDKKFNPEVKSRIAALNDGPQAIYNYGARVVEQIAATELHEYVKLAKKINGREDIKILNIQHEFGLFGGEWGDYIIPFLQALEKPAVITFHSVISEPDEHLRGVVRDIARYSKALIVMNKLSGKTLVADYEIPKSKIAIIPHGIPQATFEPSDTMKEALGLTGKTVLSTFGLLSPNKGIEHAIRSLPKVIERFPNVVYLVLGETHPVVRRDDGETYRNFLVSEVNRLNLNNNVKFYNKYLTLEEIVSYLKATDIYIAPAIDVKQSVSGTLSYALGCGRPIIATASEYARYIINEKNGVLVRPKSNKSLTNAILRMLEDPKWMKSMCAESYEQSRHMIWPNVAASHMKLYKRFANLGEEEKKLPAVKLDHLLRLTDDLGIVHFARYSTPEKKYGYSLDDNARALIAASMQYAKNPEPEILGAINTYLGYMKYVSRSDGTFANIVSQKRERDKTKDEDVQGRAIWALGYILHKNILPEEARQKAELMFKKTFKIMCGLKSPRAIAFAMTGLYCHLKTKPNKNLMKILENLANAQVASYIEHSSPDWQWFEPQLTYSNAILPESLFYAYDLLKDKKYLRIADQSLRFLKGITFEKNHYSPIGQKGWYFKNKTRAYFDQQPEDTAHMVQAKIAAYNITGNERHFDDAYKAFQWFLGKNFLNQVIYDEVTGGCHDGLGKDGVNLNQGAESTISFLLARLAFENIKRSQSSLVQEA